MNCPYIIPAGKRKCLISEDRLVFGDHPFLLRYLLTEVLGKGEYPWMSKSIVKSEWAPDPAR